MDWQQQLLEFGVTYGIQLVSAILIYFAGRWIIKFFVRRIYKISEKKLDKTLAPFVKSSLNIILLILLLITIGSTLGIRMTSFIAVLSAVAFAVGLSLQGSLSNFAGGILILIFRPFNVDDFIEIPDDDLKGKVISIQILYTTLLTRDNKEIVIPNGRLSNNNIINYNKRGKRRVDLVFGIGYEDNINKAKNSLNDIVQKHDLIFSEPEPLIRVGEHAGSSININCFVWCKSEDYWSVYYDLMEEVKMTFDQEGINIPYPQMDVHLENND